MPQEEDADAGGIPRPTTISLPTLLSRAEPLPEDLVFVLLAPLITPHKEARDHHLCITSAHTAPTADYIRHITSCVFGLKTTLISADHGTSPLDLVKGFLPEEEYKPKRRATSASKRHANSESMTRAQRIFSTSVTIAKRTLAQVIILENFHLAKMEVQSILLEVMRERRLVTDFGAYSTPKDFLIICVSPPHAKLWEYLMDQFYISYDLSAPLHPFPQPPSKPILTPQDLQTLQSQAGKVTLSPLIRSYISSILIGLRLHPHVVSTSISSRAVGDIRSLIKVACLREAGGAVDGVRGWANAGFVPEAVELCTRFRLRVDELGGREGTFKGVLEDVLDHVRAPF